MEKVFIPRRQLNIETNLKFSTNVKKFGHPPSKVRIGQVMEVEFEDPRRLTTIGVYCDSKVITLLMENVPGFKAAIHLVIPSPIGQKVLAISLRSLLCRFGRYYNRFDLLGGKNKGTSPAIKNGDIVNYPED